MRHVAIGTYRPDSGSVGIVNSALVFGIGVGHLVATDAKRLGAGVGQYICTGNANRHREQSDGRQNAQRQLPTPQDQLDELFHELNRYRTLELPKHQRERMY